MEKNGLSEYIESWKKKVLEKSELVAGASGLLLWALPWQERKEVQMIGWESERWGFPGVMSADCQEWQETDSSDWQIKSREVGAK